MSSAAERSFLTGQTNQEFSVCVHTPSARVNTRVSHRTVPSSPAPCGDPGHHSQEMQGLFPHRLSGAPYRPSTACRPGRRPFDGGSDQGGALRP